MILSICNMFNGNPMIMFLLTIFWYVLKLIDSCNLLVKKIRKSCKCYSFYVLSMWITESLRRTLCFCFHREDHKSTKNYLLTVITYMTVFSFVTVTNRCDVKLVEFWKHNSTQLGMIAKIILSPMILPTHYSSIYTQYI